MTKGMNNDRETHSYRKRLQSLCLTINEKEKNPNVQGPNHYLNIEEQTSILENTM